MDNYRLDYIEKVAEFKSITKASEALFITPSALSKFIKKLEDELGVPLFDRVGKQFILTYAGERYLQWQRKLSSVYNDMQVEMSDIAHSYVGRIRIGVQNDGSSILVNEILPEFRKLYPRTFLEIYEDTSRNLARMIEDNLVDMAIIPDRDFSSQIATIELCQNHRVLVVPKDHDIVKAARNRKGFTYPWIDVTQIKDAPFISTHPNQGPYALFEELSREYNVDFNIVAYVRNLSSILQCVINGVGFHFSDDQIIKANYLCDQLSFLSVGSDDKSDRQVIAYNSNHYLTFAMHSLIDMCIKAYRR